MATAMTGGTAKLVKTGYKNGNSDYPIKLYVYYKITQDIANNKSTINLGMYFTQNGGSLGPWTDSGSGSYLGVGSTKTEFSGSFSNTTSSTYWLASGKTFTVNHNADGTGSAKIVWKWNVNSSWGKMVYPSGEFTITLPTIPRKSSIDATDVYIENSSKLTITRKSSNFTHTLQYKISGQSSYTTIKSKIEETTYNWKVPVSAYDYIKDNKVTITIKCITYNGTTKIGETTTTLTATGKAKSTISISAETEIEETNGITISSNSNSFTHTLQYKISGQSSYSNIVTGAKTSSNKYTYNWKIPFATYSYLSSNKVTITIKCITYMGSVKIGESTKTFTAKGKGKSSIATTSSNVEVGTNNTVTITRKSSSFTHTLKYKISGQSNYTTIATKTTKTSISIPLSSLDKSTVYKLIGSKNKEVQVSVICTTYASSVDLGDTSTTFKIKCKESECKPTFEYDFSDSAKNKATLITQNTDKAIIPYYNKITLSTKDISAKYSATIVKQEITDGSKTFTSTSKSNFTASFNNITKNSFTIKITDSRGYVTTKEITKTKASYYPLSGSLSGSININLVDSTEETYEVKITAELSGKGFIGKFIEDSSFASKSNEINYNIQYSTDKKNWSSLESGKVSKLTNNEFEITPSKTIEATLEVTNAYYVKATISDLINESIVLEKTLLPDPIFYWGKNKFVFNTQVFSNHSIHCKAPLNLPSNYYYGTNTPGHGLNCNNSDIIGVNGIRFNDLCGESVGSSEGIFFLTDADSGKFDKLTAYGGNLYFSSKGSEHTSLCYTPGDTLNIGDNTPLAGYVSNARKTVFFSIPINKPLVNVIKTTLSGKIELRGIGGYVCSPTTRSATIDLSAASTEKITITTALQGSLIRAHVTFEDDLLNGGGYTTAATDAATVLNNTPLCIVPDGTLTITFG